MALSQEFMAAVSAQNELRTRIMLSNYMLTDPTFKDFDESLKYALDCMPGLVVPHNGEQLNYDMSAWTKDYLDKQMAAVINNFSRERIDLLRNMCSILYGKKVEETHRERFIKEERGKAVNTGSKKQVGTVAAGAGIVAAVAGVAVSSTPLTVIGVVAAVAGGVLIISDKSKE